MAELGNRANVMGPQPIANRREMPPAMMEAGVALFELLASGRLDEVEALAMPQALAEVLRVTDALRSRAGSSTAHIIAYARSNDHYYVKGKLLSPGTEPFTAQFRIGPVEGRWMIWEAYNLSGGRTGWSSPA